jgi:hypothetical protein
LQELPEQRAFVLSRNNLKRSFAMKSLTKSLMFVAIVFGVKSFAAEGSNGSVNSSFPEMRKAEPSEYRPSIGITLGLAETDDRSNAAAGYGIEAAFQPYIPFGVAAELSGYTSGSDTGQAGLTRTKLLAKGTYNFGGTNALIRYSYTGFGLGPVMDNIANSTELLLGIEPIIGFDIPLTDWAKGFSLGGNANYLFVTGGHDNVFALNAVAKYWF